MAGRKVYIDAQSARHDRRPELCEKPIWLRGVDVLRGSDAA
jgi:hypothetical protein